MHDINDDDALPTPDMSVIVSLHAQAMGLPSIWALVFVVLTLNSIQYTHYRDLVLLTLHCYTLDDHIFTEVVVST